MRSRERMTGHGLTSVHPTSSNEEASSMSSYEPLQPAAQTPAQQEPPHQQGPSRSAAFARKLAPLVIVATLLIIFTTTLMVALEWLRGRRR